MTPLPILLRDSCLAAVAFAAVGVACGHGMSVAAGAIGGTLNVVGLILAVSGAPEGIAARLSGQQIAALGVLYVLLSRFEPGPAMIGLLAPLAAITLRALAGVRPLPSSPTGVDG